MAAKHLQQEARIMGHKDLWIVHPMVLLAQALDPQFFKNHVTVKPESTFSIGAPAYG
jgi:hypothetical protein